MDPASRLTENPKVPGAKVAVLGLGETGYESARYLNALGFQVFASDGGSEDKARRNAERLVSTGMEAEWGRHSPDRILSADWVLISPGIRPTTAIGEAITRAGLPVFSEIEVASWFCPSSNIIAVTGSNGKTTVTTLVRDTLAKQGFEAMICGNIGNPWIGELERIRPETWVVLELSSFQLMYCRHFRPRIGVVLNLSPNHLDWHRDMAEYSQAKARLFQSQTAADYAVLRFADKEKYFSDIAFKSRVVFFDREDAAGNPNEKAVRVVARLAGCGEDAAGRALAEFKGIEHRMEKAAAADGVTYINDSKSTTTASLAWALEQFADGTVVLLAGGHPKTDDFDSVRELVRRKVKLAVLIGEATPLLRRAWTGAAPLTEAVDFRDAVLKGRAAACVGDTVILSPACASFDMFRNYMERGTLFKQLVTTLKTSAAGAV